MKPIKRKLGSYQILKLPSSYLKRKNYKVRIDDLSKARLSGKIIKLGENQFLETLNKLKGKEVDFSYTDSLESEKRSLLRKKNSSDNRGRIKEIDNELDLLLFVPEIISVEFKDTRHYKNILDNGLYVNDREYVRFLSGSGNIRRNTVFFIDKEYKSPMQEILDNGRDLSEPLNPAKYNAYFGLCGSAGYRVSTPLFAVIPDYEYKRMGKFDFIHDSGDIEEIEREVELNVFDGQGLISPRLSKRWGDELGLDYLPSSFIIRAPFLKGQVVTFDYDELSKKLGASMGTDLWGNEFVIQDMDLIISESQFKLGSSYGSLQEYLYHMNKNELSFRVLRYSPKELRNDTSSNYMFLQVLDLDDDDIYNLTQHTLKYFEDIQYADEKVSALYLSGANAFEQSFTSDDFHNLDIVSKSILAYPPLLHERYMGGRIHNVLAKKDKQAKLGKLFFQGNYSLMVSDPYAQAEWLCGHVPEGLLKEDQFYSSYWNRHGVKEVPIARPPLTHNSEMRSARLVDGWEHSDWYQYLDACFVFNIWGLDVFYLADADFDGDILHSNNRPEFINKAVRGNPIDYNHGAAEKSKLSEEFLIKGDIDGMGSSIGFITNSSSALHCMKYNYEVGSPEHNEIERRLKIFRQLQGSEIDKAKTGESQRKIPDSWSRWSKDISELDKKLVADKRPYFTRYLYDSYNKKYREHVEAYNKYAWSHFNRGIEEILGDENRNKKEQEFVNRYYKYSFFLFSESPMNKVC